MKSQPQNFRKDYNPPVCKTCRVVTQSKVLTGSRITQTSQPTWGYGDEIEEW